MLSGGLDMGQMHRRVERLAEKFFFFEACFSFSFFFHDRRVGIFVHDRYV